MSDRQVIKSEKDMESYFFRASAGDFKRIPGTPIAYWVHKGISSSFDRLPSIGIQYSVRSGITTGDNGNFIFYWFEVSRQDVIFGNSDLPQFFSPHNKGGEFRKWFGNIENVLKYGDVNINKMKNLPGYRADGGDFFYREMIGWSKITSYKSSFRYYPEGMTFNTAGLAIFENSAKDGISLNLLGMLNSKACDYILRILNPTLNISPGVVSVIPFSNISDAIFPKRCIDISKFDWDSYETSLDFSGLQLLNKNYLQLTLAATYQKLRAHWREMTQEIQRLEEENNRIFIDAYGLQDELTTEVPLNEITLTCNPHYRYGGDKSDEELEAQLLADTMRELVSYAIGCMFGRYSLDKPGLILANQGETLANYLAQVPQPLFPADDDNVIPLLDGDWFPDEITLRFRQFLRAAFGDAHYEDNLAFIEQALNVKGRRNYGLRDYFLGEFYADHVKRYKKRPIYWMFSSPKGSFNALIYMHRYRPDTVSVVLKYLRDYREKLTTEKERQAAVSINPSSSQGEKTKALKDVDRLAKVLTELDDYERDVLYPLATEQVQIDLDDGVKVNYLKFGGALKKIAGLEAKDED